MFLYVFVSLILYAFFAFQFHAVQAIICLFFMCMETAKRCAIERAWLLLFMVFLFCASMELLVAFSTIYLTVLWTIINGFCYLTIFANNFSGVPFLYFINTFANKINFILHTNLRFILDSVFVRVNV